jgi:hypothetical protein
MISPVEGLYTSPKTCVFGCDHRPLMRIGTIVVSTAAVLMLMISPDSWSAAEWKTAHTDATLRNGERRLANQVIAPLNSLDPLRTRFGAKHRGIIGSSHCDFSNMYCIKSGATQDRGDRSRQSLIKQ